MCFLCLGNWSKRFKMEGGLRELRLGEILVLGRRGRVGYRFVCGDVS